MTDTDFIQEVIDRKQERGLYYTCFNCTQKCGAKYANATFCFGIVRHPDKLKPYDVIRYCERNNISGEVLTKELTPDEAFTAGHFLVQIANDWLFHFKPYQEFIKDRIIVDN